MRSAIVLPGLTPRWVEQHARHLAEELAVLGRVRVLSARAHEIEHVLPGEVGMGSVLGNSLDGYPLWTGGLSGVLGVRHRQDAVVIVMWDGASMTLAGLGAAIARVRGERVLLDLEYAPGERARGARGLLEQLVIRLASATVRHEPNPTDDLPAERVVVALCGRDTGFARTVHAAFTGLSDRAVEGWRLRMHFDPDAMPFLIEDGRHRERLTVHPGAIEDVALDDAALVLAPHGAAHSGVLDRAVSRGAAGVVVGHPVAGRIVRRADGVWLASNDPSSVLVAMESSTGANREAMTVARAQRIATSDAVVAGVARFLEPVGA